MSNETTDNFWTVFNDVELWEPPLILFRLYYDEQGRPIEYSHEDKPGNYIEVDPPTFQLQSTNICIVDGKIIQIAPPQLVTKLVPNQEAGTYCSQLDVCIVVPADQPHTIWSLTTNETNN
jgi:hypothetical protein